MSRRSSDIVLMFFLAGLFSWPMSRVPDRYDALLCIGPFAILALAVYLRAKAPLPNRAWDPPYVHLKDFVPELKRELTRLGGR